MKEASKTKKLWGHLEESVFVGKGIDIGCGDDPIKKDVRCFDKEHGDANEITKYVFEQFDFVHASHCLEHMYHPKIALMEWWKLVKPGGYLCFVVPDEDLYEQGAFPSRFNPDHKATFTISKQLSWSPISINVFDLAESLPNGKILKLVLQDHEYDRRLINYSPVRSLFIEKQIYRLYRFVKRNKFLPSNVVDFIASKFVAIDQTLNENTVAQIQCIVKKGC